MIALLFAAALAGRVSVIDGDTLDLHGTRIRIWGVDAPEGRQPCDRDGKEWRCGQAAALAVADFIGTRTVTCERVNTDRYGRTVARCKVDGKDLGDWAVRNGWALDYAQYSKRAYAGAQADAMAHHRGVWVGTLQAPWEWRKAKRGGKIKG